MLRRYVFCRQRQDESLRRGGEQVSVVVLSEHPFSSVLRPLSQVAGPMYFSHGPQALQQVRASKLQRADALAHPYECSTPSYFSAPSAVHVFLQVVAEVGLWPAPTASGMLQLQVSFTTLSARLPPFDTLPHPSCALAVDLVRARARQGGRGGLYSIGVPYARVCAAARITCAS